MKTPREYQLLAIERASRDNLLLADACGLGKTLEAIETIKAVQGQAHSPALVVAPNQTVKLQWLSELTGQGLSYIYWLDSKAIPDLAPWLAQNPTGVILTHYEAMVKHLKALSQLHYSIIVADEAHRLRDRKIKRCEAIKQLRSYRKLALTGTPYDKSPAEVWSILNWLDPSFYSSYWRFYNAHVNFKTIFVDSGKVDARGKPIKREVKVVVKEAPVKDPANFARLLRRNMLQRSKEQVRADLPEKIETFIDLEMGKAQTKHYSALAEAEDPIIDIDGTEVSLEIVLTQILRKIQLTTDPSLLGLASPSVKLDWLNSWLEDNPNESVIIFTRFRATAEKLAAQLPQFKLIVGGNRAAISSEDRYIVGTISAMGEGLDLPHINNAIFLDVEWSSILMQQAIDRIHRINITNAKNIYYLRCTGTVDALVHQAIRSKWSTKELVSNYLKGQIAT